MAQLSGITVAFLTSNKGVEQPELTEPWQAVKEAGGNPVLIAPESGQVETVVGDLNPASTYPVDRTLGQVSADEFAALVLPGGTVNADTLRINVQAQNLVRAFVEQRKPIAAICHAPWTLIEADVIAHKRTTSYPSLSTDLRNARAEWVDEEVVVDDSQDWTLITSRNPGDLPAFNKALLDALS
jgi:protease I